MPQRFCTILTGLSRPFPWQERTCLTLESYARGSDFFRIYSKPPLCLFYPRGGYESINCLQLSEKKLFLGAGGRMVLATNKQKGRTLKLSSRDAFFLLLSVWVDLVFLEAWLVCHAHTGSTLFWRIWTAFCLPQICNFWFSAVVFKVMPLGWPIDDFSPHSPKLPGAFLLKDPINRFSSRSERRIMNKILGKDLWTMPWLPSRSWAFLVPEGEGTICSMSPGSWQACQHLPALRGRVVSASVVLSELLETPSECVS